MSWFLFLGCSVKDNNALELESEVMSSENLNHINSPYYTMNDFYNMKSTWSLRILSNYHVIQQTEDYSCWCASLLWALNYYWIEGYDEIGLCDLIWASELTWTSIEWINSFLDSIWLNHFYHGAKDLFFFSPEHFEEYLLVKLDSWYVTLVNWLDYWWHRQAIIWLDTMGTEDVYDDVLIMADSLDETDHHQDGYFIVPFARFFYMWEEASFTEWKYKQTFVTIFPKW